MHSRTVRTIVSVLMPMIFFATMFAGPANAADLVKPGVSGYINGCTGAANPVGRNIATFSCAAQPTQWILGTAPSFSCLTAPLPTPTIPANQVYNCDTGALQCYSAVYSCPGCVMPSTTANTSCTGTAGCPNGGGVFTNTCAVMGCPSGKSLCGTGPGACTTILTCSGGQTWNGCACTGTAYALIGATSPAGYLTTTGDITAGGALTVSTGNITIPTTKAIVVSGTSPTTLSIGNGNFGASTVADLYVFGTVYGRDAIGAINGSFAAGFKAPTLAANRWWTLPATDATVGTGYYLKSDGAGNLSWGNPSGTGSNAFVNGGNAFAAPAILGTLDANSLTFRVGGATAAFDRMTISSTGLVGINAAPSSARIEVAQSSSAAAGDTGINVTVNNNAVSSGTSNTYGIRASAAKSNATGGSVSVYGGNFSASGSSNSGVGWGEGVIGTASGMQNNVGVYGSSSGTASYGTYGVATSTGTFGYGAVGQATAPIAYGIFGQSSGTTESYGVYGDTGTSSGSASYGGRFQGTGTAAITYGGYNAAWGTGTMNYGTYSIANGAATTNYGLHAGASGATTNYAAVFSPGNVGIGDTTPLALFTVGSGDLFRVDSSGRVQAPFGGSGAGNLAYSFVGDTGLGLYRAAANELRVQTAGIDRVRVDSSGNVGIGTNAAATQLYVYHPTSGPVVSLSGLGTNYRGVSIKGTSNVEQWFVGNNNSNDFIVRLDGASDPVTVKNTSGNVGINNPSPGSKLDVKGTLRLSGATSGYVGLAPAANAGSTVYTLPSADGTVLTGYYLKSNGSGTLSWANPTDPTAFINDGNTFGAVATPAVLGTNDAKDLAFETFGATRMTIHKTTGNVGIGGAPAVARVDVFKSSSTVGEDGIGINVAVTDTSPDSSGINNTYGINASGTKTGATAGTTNVYGGKFTATGTGNAGTVWSMGVRGDAAGASTIGSYGVSNGSAVAYGTYGSATTGTTTYGGYGSASGATAYGLGGLATGTSQSIGVSGVANGSGSVSYGGYFIASGSPTTNYGIYASSSGTGAYPGVFMGGNVGIGDSNPVAMLTVGLGDRFQVNNLGRVLADPGTAAAGGLAYSFVGDTDTGIYGSAADVMRVRTGNADRLIVDSLGNVNIGTTIPATNATQLYVYHSTTGPNISLSGPTSGTYKGMSIKNLATTEQWFVGKNDVDDFVVRRGGSSDPITVKNGTGNVGIGTGSPGSALDVKGTLRLSGSTSGYVGFAPQAAAGSTVYTWPSSVPAAASLSAIPAGNAVLTSNTSGTMAWSKADACTVGRKFTGLSAASTYNGSRGGYNGLTSVCGGSATVCTVEEMINSIKCAQANAGADPIESAALAGNPAWIIGGPPGTETAKANDCNGWTSSATDQYGRYWLYDGNGGKFNVSTCNQQTYFACCN